MDTSMPNVPTFQDQAAAEFVKTQAYLATGIPLDNVTARIETDADPLFAPAVAINDALPLHALLVPDTMQGTAYAIQLCIKRGMDIVISTLLLVLLAPVMLSIALAIKFDSPGPVFYNRPRVGKGGRPFTMFKFRTMVPDAEDRLASLQHLNAGGAYLIKIPNDPRITRVGRCLRSSSLDELPQLLNVLKGEMSLIGPRPQAPNEVALYTPQQQRRLDVRPGITGLWQVRDRHNPSFDQWVRWDLTYIAEWSLWLDISIAGATVRMIALDIWRTVTNGMVARS